MGFQVLNDQKSNLSNLGTDRKKSSGKRGKVWDETVRFINTAANPFVRPEDAPGKSGSVRVHSTSMHEYLAKRADKGLKTYFLTADNGGTLVIFDNSNHIQVSDKGKVKPSSGKSVTRSKAEEGKENKNKFTMSLAGITNHLAIKFPEVLSMEFGNSVPIKLHLSEMKTIELPTEDGEVDTFTYWEVLGVSQPVVTKSAKKAEGVTEEEDEDWDSDNEDLYADEDEDEDEADDEDEDF